MQNRDSVMLGSYHTNDYLPWYNNYRGRYQSYDTNSIRKRVCVGSSGIVRGNRKKANAWSYSAWQRDYLNGGLTTYRKSDGYKAQKNGYFNLTKDDFDPCASYSYPPNLYNSALSKLNEKVRGTLDLSIDLAQAGQTARMFGATDKLLLLAKLRLGGLSSVKAISSAWLEYRYGWSPLLSDIYGSLDESIRVVINNIERVKARSSEGIGDKRNVSAPSSVGIFVGDVRHSGKYVCEIGVRFRTSGHNLNRWASLNPVSIAWELTPYSFVVDWFLDIGGYIRNLETSLLYGNSFVDGYVTQGTFCDSVFTGFIKSAENNGTASCSLKYRNLNRTLLQSYPSPRMPSFKAELGSGRLLNAAALLGVLFKR